MGNFPALAGLPLALIVERWIGYPSYLQERIGHPIEWIGQLVAAFDNALNREGADPIEGNIRGAVGLLALLVIVLIPALLTSMLLATLPLGWIGEAILATPFIAQHSMKVHVETVVAGLDRPLGEGRKAVAAIVGRDSSKLDESGVARAALESLAENTSDGIVAPALYFAVFGLPGIVLYKAINTADSMIGHRSERYVDFGWAAARLDDLVNLPASRLTGLLFVVAAALESLEAGKSAMAIMFRDAGKHISPNAGWPESALAGALGVRLGGPRSYHGYTVDLPTLGDGRSDLNRHDIARGLRLYRRVLSALLVLALAGAILSLR